MKIIDDQLLRDTYIKKGLIAAYDEARQGLGIKKKHHNYAANLFDIPVSLGFALDCLFAENSEVEPTALDSMSFFSLLYGLYLPLSGMLPERIGQIFHIHWQPRVGKNQTLVEEFLHKDLGLTLTDKVAYLLGDPFAGGVSRIGQDTLFQILASIRLISPKKLRQRLAQVGDIGFLFTEEISKIKSDPALTAKEVFIILRNLPNLKTNRKKEILRDLFLRGGKLECYYLARLLLRRLNFGYEYRTQLVIQALANTYSCPVETIENAIALSDIFMVAEIVEKEGVGGLAKLVLKPLNPVSPALAGIKEIDKKSDFPVWVECKYDGIRVMVHKDTGMGGRVKYAAFTRRKHDWLDLVPGLETSLQWISCHSFVIDGELHGTFVDLERGGVRPASVYDVYKYLQGNSPYSIRLQYVIFDILYLDGQELIKLQWYKRHHILERLITPVSGYQLSIPISLAEGWEAKTYAEFQKWYRHFQDRGFEGAMAKIVTEPYSLGKRTNAWLKKKSAIYLDLLVSGGFWATAERGPQIFSSYELSCFTVTGFKAIGRSEGLAQRENAEILQRVMTEGLITGETIEIRAARATRQGAKFFPVIVATVRIEGVVKDQEGIYSLRDPKIVCIRPRGDVSPDDVDTYETVTQLYLKYRLK